MIRDIYSKRPQRYKNKCTFASIPEENLQRCAFFLCHGRYPGMLITIAYKLKNARTYVRALFCNLMCICPYPPKLSKRMS